VNVDDPEILSEREYLAAARAALRGMHRQVVDTETPELHGEIDQIWHNTVYRLARARRARDLVDLPDVPLFFGRLDYQPGSAYGADQVYIGRRHVRDGDGTPMVVDWRAPVSMPFYRASRDDPKGVRLRRRYGFSDAAELTAYEDEPLVGGSGFDGSALVAAEIERPRAGPMRDIVATIQPDQDELVRAPLHPTICIQGAPGTGKTAVGLHRLAYLLYTERERLGEVAVVGPNRSFLTYIRRVLPALGEVDVSQATIEELIGRRVVRPAEPDPEVARIKGDARMATVLHRALWRRVGTWVPEEGLVYIAGSHRYRVGAARIAETIDGLRGTTRYLTGRAALAQRLAHLVLYQMERRGATPDDRDQAAVARSKPVKQLLDQVWPRATPEQVLYGLLSDPALLAGAAEGTFSADEQAGLRWPKPARSWRSAQWTTADAVLLDELSDLVERTPSLGHVVVDEAQDLSPMQARALGRRAGGSLTVLGDLAQATSPWAAGDWSVLLAHLGQPDARLAVLDQGFRVPAQIIDYAARLLPEIAPGLGTPRSVRRASGALHITRTSEGALVGALAAACREGLAGDGSVGLILADADAAAVHRRLVDGGLAAALLGETEDAMEAARLVCVPATLAKGLEFDAVVVAEPARIVAAEPRGLHRLYVVLTRAVSSLHLVHAEPLPAALHTPDAEPVTVPGSA
jgi:DNA helicase IV